MSTPPNDRPDQATPPKVTVDVDVDRLLLVLILLVAVLGLFF